MSLFCEEINVKSGSHFDSLKTDLLGLTTNKTYWDIECICQDGLLKTNRFYIGMIFPQITDHSTALLPDYKVSDVSKLFSQAFQFLSHMEGYNDTESSDLVPYEEAPVQNESEFRKVVPRNDIPIDPGAMYDVDMTEGATPLHTARPQVVKAPIAKLPTMQLPPLPLPTLPNAPLPPAPRGQFPFLLPMQPVMGNPVAQPQNPMSQPPQNAAPLTQPPPAVMQAIQNMLPGTAPVAITVDGQRYVISKPGSKQAIVKQVNVAQPVRPVTSTMSPTLEQVMLPNGKPNKIIVQQREPKTYQKSAATTKPYAKDNEVLVAKAPLSLDQLPKFSSPGSSLLSAQSVLNSMGQKRKKLFDEAGRLIGYHDSNQADVITERPKVYDNGGRLIGYKKSYKKDKSEDEWENDVVNVIEPGSLYMVNNQRSKIKSFKINCKKTKLSEAQLEEIKKEEMEQKELEGGQGVRETLIT
eukprot:TRINITY_DN4349_c0_g1_i5.p1 TRINITY_DN4349_c0_g1~~TRINITY_DN4349_c0_g1_i5.p1  ORF type:complete len:467 (-),score=88.14 TRINITY_DN4349_c0_g1_i5:293-1693(-)